LSYGSIVNNEIELSGAAICAIYHLSCSHTECWRQASFEELAQCTLAFRSLDTSMSEFS